MSIRAFVVRRSNMEALLDHGSSSTTTPLASAKTWSARVLRALLVLFLVMDGAGKVLRLAPYVEGTARVGYPASSLVPLGLVLLACTALYVLPRTAVLGAVLLTGYFGGAIATHVRLGEPFWMALVFGVLVWATLYVADERVAILISPPGRTRRHAG